MKTVKIIDCDVAQSWYRAIIGAVFNVYSHDRENYILAECEDHNRSLKLLIKKDHTEEI